MLLHEEIAVNSAKPKEKEEESLKARKALGLSPSRIPGEQTTKGPWYLLPQADTRVPTEGIEAETTGLETYYHRVGDDRITVAHAWKDCNRGHASALSLYCFVEALLPLVQRVDGRR